MVIVITKKVSNQQVGCPVGWPWECMAGRVLAILGTPALSATCLTLPVGVNYPYVIKLINIGRY